MFIPPLRASRTRSAHAGSGARGVAHAGMTVNGWIVGTFDAANRSSPVGHSTATISRRSSLRREPGTGRRIHVSIPGITAPGNDARAQARFGAVPVDEVWTVSAIITIVGQAGPLGNQSGRLCRVERC